MGYLQEKSLGQTKENGIQCISEGLSFRTEHVQVIWKGRKAKYMGAVMVIGRKERKSLLIALFP